MQWNKAFLKTWYIIALVCFWAIAVAFNIYVRHEQHFIYLANSFLSGVTYFLQEPGSWTDTVLHNGRYYWPNPPFPVLLLIPFVFISNIIGVTFFQGYLQIVLGVIIFFVIHKIALTEGYKKVDGLYWAFAFCFASAFAPLLYLPWSWQFSHVVAVLFIFLSLREYQLKNRPLVIGILYGCILATRFSAAVGIIFFIFEVFVSKKILSQKFRSLFLLILPLVISLTLLSLYNHTRYGVITEQGYVSNNLINEALSKGREEGVFSVTHIPTNLYYLFISSPLPVFRDSISQVLESPYVKANHWGMGIFYTSPYFLYLFFSKFKSKDAKLLIASVVIIAVPILLYFGIGFRQMGYRYSTDFLPFLLLLLMREYKISHSRLSNRLVVLFMLTAISNLYLFLTIWI